MQVSKILKWPPPDAVRSCNNTWLRQNYPKSMHLHVLSDLHQEFGPYQPLADEADAIIFGRRHAYLK